MLGQPSTSTSTSSSASEQPTTSNMPFESHESEEIDETYFNPIEQPTPSISSPSPQGSSQDHTDINRVIHIITTILNVSITIIYLILLHTNSQFQKSVLAQHGVHIAVFGIMAVDLIVHIMNVRTMTIPYFFMTLIELIYVIVFALLYFTGNLKQRKKKVLGVNISFIILNFIVLNWLLKKG